MKRSDDVLCRLHLLNQWLKEKEAGVKRRERNMPSMHKDFLLIRLFFFCSDSIQTQGLPEDCAENKKIERGLLRSEGGPEGRASCVG